MVGEQRDAVDPVELASRTGLHHHRAFPSGHAVLRRSDRAHAHKPGGRGSPTLGYRAVEQRLDYRRLAEMLAMELGDTLETRARRAQHAGRE